MPEYVLDTSGQVCRTEARDYGTISRCTLWRDLDAFTQGYIEAMFFTENAPGVTTEEWQATEEHDEGSIPGDVGFADLAPETLARIIDDCAKFQATMVRTESGLYAGTSESIRDIIGHCIAIGDVGNKNRYPHEQRPLNDDAAAGRDFWYTRNGHGVGFWDGDWPEPYATALTEAARAFGSVDAYLGDDGKVYLS